MYAFKFMHNLLLFVFERYSICKNGHSFECSYNRENEALIWFVKTKKISQTILQKSSVNSIYV